MKTRFRFLDIIYILAIIAADLLIYMVLGLLLMGYDDNWNPSKGTYLSWASMNASERLIYACLLFWNLVNLIGIIYLIRTIYKRYFKRA